MRWPGPSTDRTAVAPISTITLGARTAISWSSQGLQARVSATFGVAWMRRLPRGFHLKCFTALVT